MRVNDRKEDEIRPLTIEPNFITHPEGSVLISLGDTKVICNATVEEKVPHFLKGEQSGWITAEYAMLPRATQSRNIREAARGRIGGRTYEIQRLIGRAMRSVTQLDRLGERTIWLDCDVIQADGGTRTAAITGSFVALIYALNGLVQEGTLTEIPVTSYLSAISVGIVDDVPILDLDSSEDFRADTDMNVAKNDMGEFIEIQATGENHPFSNAQLERLLALADTGIAQVIQKQEAALDGIFRKAINGGR